MSVAFSPLGTCVATGSMDLTAKIWNVESGEEMHTLKVSLWQGGVYGRELFMRWILIHFCDSCVMWYICVYLDGE